MNSQQHSSNTIFKTKSANKMSGQAENTSPANEKQQTISPKKTDYYSSANKYGKTIKI